MIRLALLSILLSLTRPSTSGEPLVVEHVSVVPMTTEGLLADRTVVIEDGRIARVAPADEVRVPAGATVVDGRGRFLIPGLVDAHVHLNEGEEEYLAAWLAAGVTTIQCMHGSSHALGLREAVRSGQRVGPRIMTTGPTTAREGVHSLEDVARHVAHVQSGGYDAVKMYGDGSDTMPAESYLALVDQAHAAGLRVTGHAPRNLPFAIVLEAGQDSIDHCEELVYTHQPLGLKPWVDFQFGRRAMASLGADPVPADPASLAEPIAELAAAMHERGLALTPTLITFSTIERMVAGDVAALAARPEMRLAHPLKRRAWTNDGNRFRRARGAEADLRAAWFASALAIQRRIVAAAEAAGVPLMTGTDAPFDLVAPGRSLHDEVAQLVACGLSPARALRAATVTPGEELGLGVGSGTIAEGVRADCVLLEANPLEDVRALDGVVGVVADGRWHTRASLEAPLEALITTMEASRTAIDAIEAALEREDVAAALARCGEHPADRQLASWVESRINDLGYARLRAGEVEAAIALFETNTRAFPDSWNAWDSLGEASAMAGDVEIAIGFYEHSLELNPGNANGRRALERLR